MYRRMVLVVLNLISNRPHQTGVKTKEAVAPTSVPTHMSHNGLLKWCWDLVKWCSLHAGVPLCSPDIRRTTNALVDSGWTSHKTDIVT